MENPINKIRQSSIVFEKTGILFENIETSFNYPRVFLLEFGTRFLLTSVYKSVQNFSYFV